MSRVGIRAVEVPQGVTVEIKDRRVVVFAAERSVELLVPEKLSCVLEENTLFIRPSVDLKKLKKSQSARIKSRWGVCRQEIFNAVQGLKTGFLVVLDINGVGCKAVIENRVLVMHLGYSHPIRVDIPNDLELTAVKGVVLEIRGHSKKMVGDFAAKIERLRKPDPYKAKGVQRRGRFLLRKQGKAA